MSEVRPVERNLIPHRVSTRNTSGPFFAGRAVVLPRDFVGSWALQWRHNGRDSVSNHQSHDCLLNCLFRRRSKKTSKLRVTGLCAGNSPETGEFPTQMASNAEYVSFWWRHHGKIRALDLFQSLWYWTGIAAAALPSRLFPCLYAPFVRLYRQVRLDFSLGRILPNGLWLASGAHASVCIVDQTGVQCYSAQLPVRFRGDTINIRTWSRGFRDSPGFGGGISCRAADRGPR